MDKSNKAKLLKDLYSVLSTYSCVVVIKNNGMNVEQFNDLRNILRESDSKIKIVKNTIIKLSLVDTAYSELSPYFVGPSGIVLSNDPVKLAKSLVGFLDDNNNIEIVQGAMDSNLLKAEDIIALSKLESLDDLRSKLIRIISTPSTSIVRLTNLLQTNLVRVINLKKSN